MPKAKEAPNSNGFERRKAKKSGTCAGKVNILEGGIEGNEVTKGRIELENFFDVKIVNAGTCNNVAVKIVIAGVCNVDTQVGKPALHRGLLGSNGAAGVFMIHRDWGSGDTPRVW